jgi:ubiquinone/menaquinone biosynthesis C-methylase UbiE
MNDVAANFVGSIPEHYDRELGPRLFFGYANDLAARVSALNPKSVLELAAGTGILSRKLRDALPDSCKILATDLNPPMLETAKNKFGAEECIDFKQADASQLSFGDSSFDALVCQFGVMFFPDKKLSYREALRVLKPQGRYIFNVWSTWESNPFAQIADEVVASIFPDNPPGFYKVPFGYHDTDLICAELSDAGFRNIKTETLALTSDIPNAASFARGLVFGNPLMEEIRTRGGDPEIVCSAVEVAISRKLGSSMPLQAVIIEAS